MGQELCDTPLPMCRRGQRAIGAETKETFRSFGKCRCFKMKKVHINYPKKKIRIHPDDVQGIDEPQRQTMYDVLQDNLRIAKRVTFLHRIIYVGEHKFKDLNDLVEVFMGIIKKANETYCIEKLTGFFIYYPVKYFIHMVEGDEDNLNKHLGYLLKKSAPYASRLGMIKLLIHVSHINQRFVEDWVVYNGIPSKLLESIELTSDLEKSGRYIYNCIKKVYTLISNFVDDMGATRRGSSADSMTQDNTEYVSGSSLSEKQTMGSQQAARDFAGTHSHSQPALKMGSGMIPGRDKYSKFLPEFEFLEFVLGSAFTMTLQSYYDLYGVVPMRDIYKDRVWPVPSDFIPYDIFDKPYDCVTELVPKKVEKSDALGLRSVQSVTKNIEETENQQPPT